MKIEILPMGTNSAVRAGASFLDLFQASLEEAGMENGDVVVVAQKIVSKMENNTVELDGIEPSLVAAGLACTYEKDSRIVELVLREAKRIVRLGNRVIITETKHGIICANSGVDESNVEQGYATVLPDNADESAKRIAEELQDRFQKEIAVIVSDTFGRPWRQGQTNFAIGVYGMDPIMDYKGTTDSCGKTLQITAIAVADELAAAAELSMGKAKGLPVCRIRNVEFPRSKSVGATMAMLRPKENDLFR